MPDTQIYTYQDLVEHLLDMYDNSRAGRPLRMARRACVEATRELTSMHRWSYFESEQFLRVSAAYSTGTIAYDHTGGSAERLVTLTDGIFPDEVQHYRIIIDSDHYPIERRLSDTTITLPENQNPGADVDAGTGYQVYRQSYPLPVGFVALGNVFDCEYDKSLPVIPSDFQQSHHLHLYDTPGTPVEVAIRNDDEFLNSLSVVFCPPPSSANEYRLTLQRSPRPLVTEKYSTGTVSIASGGTECTITTGTFSAKHVGCILRLGTTDSEPTPLVGGIDDSDVQPVLERTITAVSSSGSTCTVDAASDDDYTDVKFTVSDPIDMEYGAMLTALMRVSEASYCVLTKRDRKERDERDSLAMRAVLLAKERDSRAPYAPVIPYYNPFRRVTITDDD